MTDRPFQPDIGRAASWTSTTARTGAGWLRTIVVVAGIAWSVAFVVVGLTYQLELYGDGAMFSYSVAAQNAWAFHWHNISVRLTVFLLSLLPAETYVGLTGDAHGGIAVYGFLFFVAPLVGLAATFAADRSGGRVVFGYACFSTACLCPLVFGFPTEMWMAHTLFWPSLAIAHYGRRNAGGAVLLFVLLLMLVLTHEGALVLAAAIVATLLPRGLRDPLFLRAVAVFCAAVAVWIAVKLLLPPNAYFADVLARAAADFFDDDIFEGDLIVLMGAVIAGYGAIFLALARPIPARAHIYAAGIVAAALAVYWFAFDHGLHAADRYYLRTILVVVTPVLGLLAAVQALRADGVRIVAVPGLARIGAVLASRLAARAVGGAFALLMLVHAVETAKFVTAWSKYKAAVAALAAGPASDPALGDPDFVSSARIGAGLNRLSWYSTTPYLSVIVANFAPARLVVDPRANNYFWLSCGLATENLKAERAIPARSRNLVKIYACLHRPRPVR